MARPGSYGRAALAALWVHTVLLKHARDCERLSPDEKIMCGLCNRTETGGSLIVNDLMVWAICGRLEHRVLSHFPHRYDGLNSTSLPCDTHAHTHHATRSAGVRWLQHGEEAVQISCKRQKGQLPEFSPNKPLTLPFKSPCPCPFLNFCFFATL